MSKRKISYCLSDLVYLELDDFNSNSDSENHNVIFINEIVYQAALSENQYVSRVRVIERLALQKNVGTNKSTMANREAALKKMGVITESLEVIGEKKVLIRKIETLSPLIKQNLELKNSYNSDESGKKLCSKKQMTLAFEEIERSTNVLLPSGNAKSRIEALFNGFLDASVRMSRTDRRKVIVTPYEITRSESILITTSTDTRAGKEIIELPDYRLIRALSEMYVCWVEKEHRSEVANLTDEQIRNITGEFVFDIYDLCTELKFSRNVRNANRIRAMIDRVYATHFEINAENSPLFREKFTDGAHIFNVKYLVEASEYREYEQNQDANVFDFSARLYKIKFHSSLLRGLLDPRTRHISHPELVFERSGICHRFNSWSKIAVGVTAGKSDSTKSYLLDELWEKVMPSSRADNFYRYFTRVLKKHCVGGEAAWNPDGKNLSLVYGYYIEFCADDQKEFMDLARIKRRSHMYKNFKRFPVVKITRDKDDAIVGDNSPHNLLVRRDQALMQEGVHDYAVRGLDHLDTLDAIFNAA